LNERLLCLGNITACEYYTILSDFELYEYREVIEIYSLLPKEQWENYAILEIVDQREQLLLNRALKVLKNTFIRKVMQYGQEEYIETSPSEDFDGIGS